MKRRRWLQLGAALVGIVGAAAASAHSVSNAYLTLTQTAGEHKLHGQWDIALRDLNFVLGLDDNGNGEITWGELSRHQKAIARYAYAHLHFHSHGKACKIRPTKQMVDTHADGAYAVLFFEVACQAHDPKAVKLNYRLLFNIDPSHRGILVFRAGHATSTALISPANHTLRLALAQR
jgi:hypothetical protein